MGRQQAGAIPLASGAEMIPPQGGFEGQAVQQFQGAEEDDLAHELRGMPSIDVYESPDTIHLFVDVPGTAAEEIDLRSDDQSITLLARREESLDGDLRAVQRERPTLFERTIPLPARADSENCEATAEDGVCRITLPKQEDERERRIGIQ